MIGEPIRLAQLIGGFAIGGGEVQFVELLKGLPKSYEIKVGALENMGPLREPVFEMGYAPRFFSLNGSFFQPNTLVQIGRLARWLKENRIDVVHAHDLYTIVLAVPAAKIARCRVVAGRLDLMHYHGRARRTALIVSSRAADHVVANAAAVRAMLIDEERIPPQRISLIYNGIDIAAFDARAKQGIQSPLPSTGGAPIAVLVANMEHEVKRQEDFLEALALARAQSPSLQGFLVGDGKRRPELEALAARLGLNGAAHFLGQRRDVPAILTGAGAALGVLCSSKEGLSNAVIEGMAARLPMVVTAAGGNSELVEDGKRGFLVAVARPSELADAMLRLLAKTELARRMGEAGRQFVESQLSLSRMIEAHDALYQRLARADRAS
jgi:glycosyltransferase involved in cell wall biosynthesis